MSLSRISSVVHCSHQYTQVPQQATQTPQRKFLYSVQQLSAVRPFSMLLLEEPAVRQAVAAALKSSMAVPQEPWSREFVEESVLADLAAAAPSTASLEPEGDNNSTSPSPADPGSSDAVETIPLSPAVLDLVEQYQQAAADAEGSSSDSAARQPGPKASSNRSAGTGNSKKSKAAAATALVQDTAASSSIPPELQGTLQQVQTMYGQLLQDNYVEVEDADVAAFSLRLLQELSRLVQAAAAAQQEDDGGLCQLCEREMPLTKHHLIPRDVHKDFKKRGMSFAELQAGVIVCRPCHSAIHRAVPDNKELGLHYRTLEALRQHKDISNFALWARRQRVTSKADVGSAHFRHRR